MSSIVNPRMFRVVIATALYWSWIFLMYWSDVLNVAPGVEDAAFFARGTMFIGAALSLLFVYVVEKRGKLAPDGWFAKILPFALIILAPLASCIEAFGISFSLPVIMGLWFLTGFGASFLLVGIGRAVFAQNEDNAFVVIFVSMFIACMICVFTTSVFSDGVAAPLIMMLLPVGCQLLIVSLALPSKSDTIPGREVHSSQSRKTDQSDVQQGDGLIPSTQSHEPKGAIKDIQPRKSFVRFLLQLFLNSVVFSFALLVALDVRSGDTPSIYVWLGVFLVAGMIMAYSMWLNRYFSMEQFRWLLVALMVIGLALLTLAPLLSDTARFACCVLFMIGFTGYDMLSLSKLLSFINTHSVSFPRYFTLGRFGNAFGMVIGWALAMVDLHVGAGTEGMLLAQVLPLALMVVLILAIFVLSGVFAAGDSEQQTEVSDETGAWKRSCDDICEMYKLSSREQEVFWLYAKGRDTNYICNALYISSHTVKSHVYHIFQKTGIHSQQELISRVEVRTAELKAKEAR